MYGGRLYFSESQVWTAERVAELRRLWDTGTRTRDIAAELGVGNGAVCGKAWRLGLPQRGRSGLKGPDNPRWKGGRKARWDRYNQRRRAARKRDPSPPSPPRPVISKVKPGRLCFLMGFRSEFS